jgi:hypothetical protein
MITTLLQLLKSRTVLFALLLAVLSVLQGYIFLLHIQLSGGVNLPNLISLFRLVF